MQVVSGTTSAAVAPPQSNDSAAAEAVRAFEASEEINERGLGGNRWPEKETQTLLKIRSDMETSFRDANAKGPLWDEVSRKMAEFGYKRNAKKCKEKFENLYKYHKRTKDGRTGKSIGKTYRFFDQLEAFESQQQPPPQPNNNNTSLFSSPPPLTTVMPPLTNINLPSSSMPPYTHQQVNVTSFPSIFGDILSDNSTSSSSSGTTPTRKKKRKRKWKEFFERLMKQVVDKQEELQRKFLEAVEKRDHERMVREESWRAQEISRIKREHDILAQERSMSAAKDAAVMSFLQKLSENQTPQTHSTAQPQTPQPPPRPPPLLPQSVVPTLGNGDSNSAPQASSSRWPKVEIEALIKLRTNLDTKYQENGPKGPLWEEISAGMKRLGFNRNSKRCKEKWENINKYFKKVKESNKKRPEDSKTCPYFHQLDALYRERNRFNINNNIASSSSTSGPLMVQPEQQWPPATAQPDHHHHQPPSQPSELNFDDDDEGTDEGYDDEEDEEENDQEDEFEVVGNSNNKTTNDM